MYKSVILIAVPQVFGSHPLFFRKVLLQEGHPIVAAAMLSVEEALKIVRTAQRIFSFKYLLYFQ
ncbi:hypothetical protein glysoja_048575 [Glycine soja]|uniref:Uncharacterized protein n=1 Tax=Glycine soja TaxID=3848 RepID=A0A0B2SBR5_GLYSO|nr:hypothetical protein glysoja_048575 [Glycine soja]